MINNDAQGRFLKHIGSIVMERLLVPSHDERGYFAGYIVWERRLD